MADLVAKAKTLIRRPAAQVFNAFVQPGLITQFWLQGLDVDLKFIEKDEGVTVASAEVRGFESEGGTAAVVNATEGFSIVLCDLKVLLESGHSAGLVKDKAALISAERNA